MKVCPLCGETFSTFVDFCFADGELLALENACLDVPEPEGFDAPPPPKMLQGSQQRAGYTRSATPVPRARRPGRSLIQRTADGAGVYTPPRAEDAESATPLPPPPPPEAPDLVIADLPEAQSTVPKVPEEDVAEPDVVDSETPEPEPFLVMGDDEEPSPSTETPAPLPPPKHQEPVAQPATPALSPQDEPEQAASAVGAWAMALGALVLVALVIALGLMLATSFFNVGVPRDTVTQAQPEPTRPAPPDPLPLEPVGPTPFTDPEPLQPEPVEPIAPDPGLPDPVAPDPVVPAPVVPVVPEPNDGVAVIGPLPAPSPDPVATARVKVESVPKGAIISFDGQEKGTTPFTFADVPYGSVRLGLSYPGYESYDERLLVSTAVVNTGTIALLPKPGTAPPEPTPVPDASPSPDPATAPPEPIEGGAARKVMLFHSGIATGAVVEMVGQRISLPGGPNGNLAPGSYRVTIMQPDGVSEVKQVTVSVGEGTCLLRLHLDSISCSDRR